MSFWVGGGPTNNTRGLMTYAILSQAGRELFLQGRGLGPGGADRRLAKQDECENSRPGWNEKAPDGVSDVLPRSRTATVFLLGRTAVNDTGQMI